jgi:hypothetical protein
MSFYSLDSVQTLVDTIPRTISLIDTNKVIIIQSAAEPNKASALPI